MVAIAWVAEIAGLIVRLNVFVAVAPTPSVIVIVKGADEVAAAGVPEILPVEALNVSAPGNVGLTTKV